MDAIVEERLRSGTGWPAWPAARPPLLGPRNALKSVFSNRHTHGHSAGEGRLVQCRVLAPPADYLALPPRGTIAAVRTECGPSADRKGMPSWTTWLPRLRTSAKPWEARIRQTSRPERTRSLPNRDFDMGHVDFVAPAVCDFLGGRRFEEECERFLEMGPRLSYGVSLTGNIHFRAKSNIPVALAFDDRGQLPSADRQPSFPTPGQRFFKLFRPPGPHLPGFILRHR